MRDLASKLGRLRLGRPPVCAVSPLPPLQKKQRSREVMCVVERRGCKVVSSVCAGLHMAAMVNVRSVEEKAKGG